MVSQICEVCVRWLWSENQKGYICYDPENHRMRVSKHVVLFEHMYYYKTVKRLNQTPISIMPNFSNINCSIGFDLDTHQGTASTPFMSSDSTPHELDFLIPSKPLTPNLLNLPLKMLFLLQITPSLFAIHLAMLEHQTDMVIHLKAMVNHMPYILH